MLCLFLFAGLLLCARLRVEAQAGDANWIRPAPPATVDPAKLPRLPEVPRITFGDFTTLPLPSFQFGMLQPPFAFSGGTVMVLQSAILKRLGIRYKYTGSDDRGYDCSGFVWRVFQDVGADFERVAARTLWRQLSEATADEIKQFGTLVFFNGLKHIGIVRDENTFYHSSRSQGVTVSTFDGYWGKRVTGFRRSPMPVFPLAPEAPKPAE